MSGLLGIAGYEAMLEHMIGGLHPAWQLLLPSPSKPTVCRNPTSSQLISPIKGLDVKNRDFDCQPSHDGWGPCENRAMAFPQSY